MRLPDPGKSRALLLGCGSYADPSLPPLPAVAGNLAGMQAILTSPRGTGLAPEHCPVLKEADHVREVIGGWLTALAKQVEDMLLVYYAGHGLIGPNGELFLALPWTDADRDKLAWTALPFDLLRSTLAGARASNRVLILDCCFSGLAVNDFMSGVASAVSGQLEVSGTCTLASSPANRPASAPPGEQYTAYTGELLRFLQYGSADQPELLTLTAIHEHLARALPSRGLPRPEQRNTQTIGQLALAHNSMWKPLAGHTHARMRRSAPQPRPPAAGQIPASAPAAAKAPAIPATRFILLAGTAVTIAAALLIYVIISAALPSSSASGTAGNSPTGTTSGPATHAPASPAVHAATDTGTATIGVGWSPVAVAVDPDTRTAYVANSGSGSVSVIDTATNNVTATIGVGEAPDGVAVDPPTHTAYVTNGDSGSVSVIDTATNTVTATISVGQSPQAVAVDPDTHTAYVSKAGDSVSVIDTATNTVTATISVGQSPVAVAVDPDTHTAYVINSGGGSVSVIDTATNTVTATIGVGRAPDGVAVDPAANTAYVTNGYGDSVSVINAATNTVTATIGVGQSPIGVAVAAGTHTAYVTNENSKSVSVIDIG